MSAEIESIHKPMLDFLDLEQKADRCCYTYQRPDVPATTRASEADFMIHANGFCLHLEAKDKDTRVSARQKKRHAELARVGCAVHIFRSVEEGVKIYQSWRSGLGRGAVIPPTNPAGMHRFGRSVGFPSEDGKSFNCIRAYNERTDGNLPLFA